MLGDAAVAVNPEDPRYKDIDRQNAASLPARRAARSPSSAMSYADMEFGTGCVKITPCHDPNDFEVGLRHDLDRST